LRYLTKYFQSSTNISNNLYSIALTVCPLPKQAYLLLGPAAANHLGVNVVADSSGPGQKVGVDVDTHAKNGSNSPTLLIFNMFNNGGCCGGKKPLTSGAVAFLENIECFRVSD
jgi:hypothetical protein